VAYTRNKNRKREQKRFKGSLLTAPIIEEIDIIKDIWKEVALPMWVIKKIMKSFLKSISFRMQDGHYIVFNGFGSFVPFERTLGIRGCANYDETKKKVLYKWKISDALRRTIVKKTVEEIKDADRTESPS
jgi:hypothetical protein